MADRSSELGDSGWQPISLNLVSAKDESRAVVIKDAERIFNGLKSDFLVDWLEEKWKECNYDPEKMPFGLCPDSKSPTYDERIDFRLFISRKNREFRSRCAELLYARVCHVLGTYVHESPDGWNGMAFCVGPSVECRDAIRMSTDAMDKGFPLIIQPLLQLGGDALRIEREASVYCRPDVLIREDLVSDVLHNWGSCSVRLDTVSGRSSPDSESPSSSSSSASSSSSSSSSASSSFSSSSASSSSSSSSASFSSSSSSSSSSSHVARKPGSKYIALTTRFVAIRPLLNSFQLRSSPTLNFYNALGALYQLHPMVSHSLVTGRTWITRQSTKSIATADSTLLAHFATIHNARGLAHLQIALPWLVELETKGKDWKYGDHPNLFPNMKSRGSGWDRAKKTLARQTKELTLMWQLSVRARSKMIEKSIVNLDQLKSSDQVPELAPSFKTAFDRILQVNQETYTGPPVVADELDYPTLDRDIADFYVDFEVVNECFGETCIQLVGCGQYLTSGLWVVREFFATDPFSEEQSLTQWIEYMREQTTKKGCQSFRVWCWSHAEDSMLSQAYNSAKVRLGLDFDVEWVDLCAIIKKGKVAIRGARGYGIKEVATALKKLNFIEPILQWEDHPVDSGLNCMVAIHKMIQFPDLRSEIVRYNRLDVWSLALLKEFFQRFVCTNSSSQKQRKRKRTVP